MVSVVATVLVAIWLVGFVERIGCLHAGGVYHAGSNMCELASGFNYVSPNERAGFWYWWLIWVPAVAAGRIVFTTLRRARRLSRRQT